MVKNQEFLIILRDGQILRWIMVNRGCDLETEISTVVE